jgi:hypothetical protein
MQFMVADDGSQLIMMEGHEVQRYTQFFRQEMGLERRHRPISPHHTTVLSHRRLMRPRLVWYFDDPSSDAPTRSVAYCGNAKLIVDHRVRPQMM